MPDVVLRLYIAGTSPGSVRARRNVENLRDAMKTACKLEIIDVLADPQAAEKAGVIATPTLSYDNAMRSRRVIGDLGDSRRVLDFLGIEAKDGLS